MNDAIRADVARIEEIWRDCRDRHGKGGKFLFGKFSIADAMYTPVVARLDTYDIPVSAGTKTYMDAIMSTTAFRAWKEAGLAETWIVPSDEVD